MSPKHAPGFKRAAHHKRTSPLRGCECADSRCPSHRGAPQCTQPADTLMYRIDMTDETGTAACSACADDMANSGLFADEFHLED